MTKLIIRLFIAFFTSYLLYLNIAWLTTTITSLFILSAVFVTFGLFFVIYVRQSHYDIFKKSTEDFFSKNPNSLTLMATNLLVALVYICTTTILNLPIITAIIMYNLFISAIIVDFIQKAYNDN